MRRPVAIFLALSVALGASGVACFDLFHSTADLLTACAIDAGTPGCFDAGADATPPPATTPTNFCAWTSLDARRNAQYACAWLGACETPMGRNAFGDCMLQALLAYDCEINPSHPVKGKTRSLWDCLWKVKSCSDVDSCILPAGAKQCPGTSGTACGSAGSAGVSNADVRFECADAGSSHGNAHAENCALWGKTCAADGTIAICAGAGGLACSSEECIGQPRTQLRWCVDGGDLGIDCASGGGQFCIGFPDASPPWLACAVESDAGPCSPTPSASCSNGIASACPTGILERVDCARLLLSDAGCQEGALAPPFDWSSPCAVVPSSCAESCSGTWLTGCARGAPFSVDCRAETLGACRMVTTDMGASQHPACTAP